MWEPEDAKPPDAETLEAEISQVAPGAQVKVNLAAIPWLVRALAPAALCTRGPGFDGRDMSEAVARVLSEAGHPASAHRSRPRSR
jgi:hypothetical protein